MRVNGGFGGGGGGGVGGGFMGESFWLRVLGDRWRIMSMNDMSARGGMCVPMCVCVLLWNEGTDT